MGETEVREVHTLGFAPMQNPKVRTFYFVDLSDLNNNCASFSPENSSLIEKKGLIVYLSLLICAVGLVDSFYNKLFLLKKFAHIKLEMQSYVESCNIGNS